MRQLFMQNNLPKTNSGYLTNPIVFSVKSFPRIFSCNYFHVQHQLLQRSTRVDIRGRCWKIIKHLNIVSFDAVRIDTYSRVVAAIYSPWWRRGNGCWSTSTIRVYMIYSTRVCLKVQKKRNFPHIPLI